MTTEQFLLNRFGITMEFARDFILENYENNLETIYTICLNNNITNDMVADILQDSFPFALTGEIVSTYFSANGFNGNALNSNDDDSGGTLNLANLQDYRGVVLYENVSSVFLGTVQNYDDYLFTLAENFGSFEEYGYTYDQTVGGTVQYINDDRTSSASNSDTTALFNLFPEYQGDYDLILGVY